MKNLKIILFFILCAAIQVSWAQNSLILKSGSKYEIVSESKNTTTMSMMGQEMEMKQAENSTSILEITSEEKDSYEFNVELISISANISQMGYEESYDSEEEESQNGPLGIAYDGRLNVKKQMKIDKQGNIIRPEVTDDEDIGENISELQQNFSYFVALPEDISVGKTWKENQNIKTDEMNLESERTFTVKSIDGNLIKLQVKGNMSLRQSLMSKGAEVKTNLRGTSSGEIVVGKSNNVVQRDNSFTTFEGNTQASGMDIPMSMQTTINTVTKEME